jgi:hypothetical protein
VKTKLIVLALLAAGAVFAQVSVGFSIGPPPPVRVIRVQPRSPGAGYSWIGGYWYPEGRRYRWHNGYWTRPAYLGASWMEPRYNDGQYYAGYWGGERGRVEHDHHWDRGRNHNRYFNHDRDHR